MSIIDGSWSEPHGIAVVPPPAPAPLAAGTASHAAIATPAPAVGELEPIAKPAEDAPRLFFDMPVGRPRTLDAWPPPRPDAAIGRASHDATALVTPLPRPRARGTIEPPRAAELASERAPSMRHQRTSGRRWRIALLAGTVAGLALGGIALAPLPGHLAVPTAPAATEPREAAQPAAPALPAAPPRADAAASRKAIATATKRPATGKPKTTAPATRTARKVAVKTDLPAKQPTRKAAPAKPATLAATKKPAPAKPAGPAGR